MGRAYVCGIHGGRIFVLWNRQDFEAQGQPLKYRDIIETNFKCIKENFIMTIEKTITGTAAVLKIIGRLDTTTAPELEATIDACAAGIKELVLDCTALEYVSSAGLRVILKVQKLMNAQGNMKLTHVNETIMEVFDITGFADILTIE